MGPYHIQVKCRYINMSLKPHHNVNPPSLPAWYLWHFIHANHFTVPDLEGGACKMNDCEGSKDSFHRLVSYVITLIYCVTLLL